VIEFLSGTLAAKEPVRAVIDVQGIGYEVFISLHTYEMLPEAGAPVQLFTHLHVREDAMLLYGFAGREERFAFRMLMSVSGIGVKVALAVLSGASVADLAQYIGSSNIGALTSIPGIGKKTAERMIVELRDKLGKEFSGLEHASSGKADVQSEALLALVSLGYTQQAAQNVIKKALTNSPEQISDVGALIKSALRLLARG